jgi:hypothetical protein
MSFEQRFSELHGDGRKAVATLQTAAEARIVAEPGADIAKVLCTHAYITAPEGESLSGEARLTARVNFSVVYLDTTGKCHGADATAEVSATAESEDITPGTALWVRAQVIGTEGKRVSAAEVGLRATVELEVHAHLCRTVRYVAGADGCYARTAPVTSWRATAHGAADIVKTEEYDLPGAARILIAEPSVTLFPVKALPDAALMTGKVATVVTYLSEQGDILTKTVGGDFSQEIAAAGAAEGDVATGTAALKHVSHRLVIGEAGSTLQCEHTVAAKAAMRRAVTAEGVTDAFANTNELVLSSAALTSDKPEAPVLVPERIETTAALDVDLPAVETILGTPGVHMSVANAYAADGLVTVEGVTGATVLYGGGEPGSRHAVRVESPFSVNLRVPAAREGMTACVWATPGDVLPRKRGGGELELSTGATFMVELSTAIAATAVTDIALGAEKPAKKSAFSVYYAKAGDDLWDVAKALSATPELVQTQNPALKAPLPAGERVLLYRKIAAK